MATASFSIRPLSIGAEIVGLTPDRVDDPETQAGLYAAWLEYGVLVFKNVTTIAQHLALSRCFGELELHTVVEARYKEEPLMVEIGGSKNYAFVYDDTDLIANRIPWHRDTAFTTEVCKGAMLRMLTVPPTLGDTWFSDTAKAYDDLPADVQRRLATLEYKATLNTGFLDDGRPGIWWKTIRRPTEEEFSDPTKIDYAATAARYPSVVLPALFVHPESARKCIYLSPSYVDFFLGMEKKESDAFLREVVNHMLQPKYVYKHKWDVNDAVIWDNRRMLHAAPGHKPREKRHGLRTTLAGRVEIGRFYDAKETAARPAFVD